MGDVDFRDLTVLAESWPGDGNWNVACDISTPKDGVIDKLESHPCGEISNLFPCDSASHSI